MTGLQLVHLPLDLRAFTGWALSRGYLDTPPGDSRGRPRDAEIGYAAHAALTGLFGDQAPRPFVISPGGQRERRHIATTPERRVGFIDVLGYAHAPAETLQALTQIASDELRVMIDRDGIRSKPMPAKWPQNLRLRFDLRACPVRRLMKPLTTRERPELPATTFRKGKEVDAFQVATARAQDSGEPIPARDRIYIEWLAERLATQPERARAVALVPDSVRVESYRSVCLLRRPPGANGGRSAQWLTRPDVRFTGLLDIIDPTAFPTFLTRGVGRHCGFGFGMLLLKPK